MKHVLYFCQYYPPYQTTESFRAVKTVKELVNNGIKVTIITSYDGEHDIYDATIADIPKGVKVFRVNNYIKRSSKKKVNLYYDNSLLSKIKNNLLMLIKDILIFPDVNIFWSFRILPTVIKLVKNEKIDHILVNIPPFSLAVLALLIKKITKIEYSIDIRDEWRTHYKGVNKLFVRKLKKETLPRRLWNLFLENICVNNSKNVFTVSNFLKEYFDKQYPNHKRNYVCYNGYLKNDFSKLKTKKRDSDFYTYYYVGKMDVMDLSYNPEKLFQGFKLFLEKYNEKKCKFHIIGSVNDKTKALVDSLGLGEYVIFHGRIERSVLLNELVNADILVHFYYPDLHPEAISLKVFEYLYYNKPIMSCSNKNGEMGSFIHKTQSGITCWGNDENQIAKVFYEIQNFNTEILSSCERKGIIAEYDFSNIAKIFVSKIFEV